MARLEPEQLVRLGNAAYGAGLSLLALGRPDEAGEWLERAAARWRESWEHATPTSWGRPIGTIKAALIAGRDEDAAAFSRWALELGSEGAESHRGPDQRAGLAGMHVFEFAQAQRAPYGGQVQRLAAGHAFGAAGAAQRLQHPDAHGRRDGTGTILGEQLERQRLQGVAGEDRHRLAELDVAGGPAATQRIVVHRGQVVVHQRVGVDQFHHAGRCIQRGAVLAQRFRRGVDQQRAQPLDATQPGIAHRTVQFGGGAIGRRQATIERLFGTLDQ